MTVIVDEKGEYPRDFGLLQEVCWHIADDHGFHKEKAHTAEFCKRKPSAIERLGLIHSELSEALEFARDATHEGRTDGGLGHVFYEEDKHGRVKPEGFAVELADAVIRILDCAEEYGINLLGVIHNKMAYNEGRPYMHGRGI